MDDFSVPGRNNSFNYPPNPGNYIRPRHRALSSMSPTILLKDDKVVMAVGASGGSLIPTATAQVSQLSIDNNNTIIITALTTQIILDVLSFGDDLLKASSYPRLHDQLIPDSLYYEPGFPNNIVQGLKEKNHNTIESNAAAVVQAIYINDKGVNAASDKRKGGQPDGY